MITTSHNRSLNAAFCLALLLSMGSPVLVRAQSDGKQKTAAESRLSARSWETWREGFEASEAGEAALIAGRNEEAAEYYKRALQAFKTVKKNNPNWNKNVINYRISLAEKRMNTALRRIEFQRTGSHEPAAVPSGSIAGSSAIPHTPSDPQAEIAALRSALKEAEARNAPLQKDAERGRLASSQVDGLIADKKETEAKYNTLLLQYEALKKNAEASASGNSELEKAYKEEQFRSEALKKLVADLRKDLDKAREQARIAEKEVSARDEKIAKADAAIASVARSEKLLSDVRRDYADLQKAVLQQREKTEARQNELSATLKEKIEECTRLENELKELRLKSAPAETVRKLQAEADELRRDKETLSEKYNTLDKELRTLNDRLSASSDRATTAGNMIASLNAKNTELTATADALRKTNAEQEKKLSESAGKIASLERSNKELKGEIAILAERVNKTPVAGTGSDTALLKKEMELKKQVEENEILAVRVKELEKSLAEEKSKSAPQPEKIQVENPVNAELQNRVKEQETEIAALKEALASAKKETGATDNETKPVVAVVPVPVSESSSDEKLQALLKERDSEIENLKKTLEERTADAEEAQKAQTGLNEKIRELTASLEDQKNELQIFRTEKSKTDEDTRKLSRDLLNTQALLEKAKLEAQDTTKIREAERERDEWKIKCEAATDKAEKLRLTLSDREKTAEIARKKIDELETKCDTLDKRAARAETKLAGWEKGTNAVSKEEYEKKNQAIESLLKEHKRLLEEQAADRRALAEMDVQLSRYRKTLQLSRDVTEKAMEESRKLRAELVMYRRRDPNPRPEVPKTVAEVPQEVKVLTNTENNANAQIQNANQDKYESCMAAARKALEQGKQEDALWQLWAAADAGVNQPEPYLEITRIHISRNNPEQGIKTYEKALRLGAKRIPELEDQLKQQILAKRNPGAAVPQSAGEAADPQQNADGTAPQAAGEAADPQQNAGGN